MKTQVFFIEREVGSIMATVQVRYDSEVDGVERSTSVTVGEGTTVGDTLICIVNGAIVPQSYVLLNGDRVEVHRKET